MTLESVDRRTILAQSFAGVAALAAAKLALTSDALAQAPAGTPAAPAPAAPAPGVPPFSFETVRQTAKALAETEYMKPTVELPEPFSNLSYDQYRDIRFKADQAIWKGQGTGFELQPFAMGWLYDTPVDVHVVENGEVRKLVADGRLFTLGPLIGSGPESAPFGFSGFRVHSPINRSDYFDEYVVFQGASYLRAVGRNLAYGASARGLAINTARPEGEEFPFFRSFWIEKPAKDATEIVVNALLDSPSTTGAYRFAISPGETTVMDITAVLYPRKDLPYIGVAPLTSMFLHGTASPARIADFRPLVHDSEGLAIRTGAGELIWRPLINPRTLQTSAFMDSDPKGFGLWQRDRDFDNYQDLEARYEKRPSIWVEPRAPWGEGFVELIEIPVEDEIHDNIVAYWKPKTGLVKGQERTFAYQLHWGPDVPIAWAGATVTKTRVGQAKTPGKYLFVVDLEGPAVKDVRDLPVAELSATAGQTSNLVVQRNPVTSGVRVSFQLQPDDADLIELRFALKQGENKISETWLYRWTKP